MADGTTGPKYPNQQLRSVTLEAYFRGKFSILCALPAIQDRFGVEYPNLFVPNAEDGAPTTLKPYRLMSEGGADAIGVALNQVQYHSRQYPGHAEFIQAGCSRIRACLALGEITELSRVVYRYDNLIGLIADERGLLPLDRVIDFGSAVMPTGAKYAGFHSTWSYMLDGVAVSVEARVEASEGGGPALALAIAAAISGPFSVDQIEDATSAVHSPALAQFEAMITDEFRSIIQSAEGAE